MNTHRDKPILIFLFSVILIMVTFACNFITSKSPDAHTTETTLPTEISVPPQSLLSPNSIPMSSGLTLKSARDTERDINGYQVTYLEDQADDFSGVNQGKIDMYFDENHNFTIHANSSKQPLVWTTGWCAQGKETLSQNLKNIRFEMRVNGQPVDLNQVYKINNALSWHAAGSYCLFYHIIVYGWTSETTTLTSKTIINEPVNDGIKDYPIGELTRTYEVINSTQTNQAPTQVPNSPISSSPTLGNKKETQSAIDSKVKSLTSLAKDTPFLYNGTTRYDVSLNNPNEHLLWWANGWCAKDEKILSKNLEQISFELSINDQPIDLEKAVAYFYKSSDGLPCLSYVLVVYDWSSGTTVLTSKIIMEANLNDGIDNYSAGDEFTKHIVITVP